MKIIILMVELTVVYRKWRQTHMLSLQLNARTNVCSCVLQHMAKSAEYLLKGQTKTLFEAAFVLNAAVSNVTILRPRALFN